MTDEISQTHLVDVGEMCGWRAVIVQTCFSSLVYSWIYSPLVRWDFMTPVLFVKDNERKKRTEVFLMVTFTLMRLNTGLPLCAFHFHFTIIVECVGRKEF